MLQISAVLAAIFAISVASVLIRFSEAPALAIATYRLGLAALALAPVAAWRTPLRELRLNARTWLLALTAGGFLAIHFGLWITSLGLTTVASSVILVTTHPLFVAPVAAWLFREPITLRKGIGILLGLVGTVIVSGGDWQLSPAAFLGDLLALGGALAMGGYLLVSRHLRGRLPFLPALTLLYGTAGGVLAVVSLLFGVQLYPWPGREWLLFWALALIPTIAGHGLMNWALKYLGATGVSISFMAEPVGAALLAYLILGEVPTGAFYAGGLAILAGIALGLESPRNLAEREEVVAS